MTTSRRQIITAAAATGLSSLSPIAFAADPRPLELPPLPWEPTALDPVIGSSTIGLHYGKHHRGYLDNLNKLLPASGFEGQTLEGIVKVTAGKADKAAFFNNAAQTWNHTFYWNSVAPKAGGKPGTGLLSRIDASFGSFDELRKATLAASAGQFGSGWVWLVLDKPSKKLAVVKTGNADTPLTNPGLLPLAVIDVWEHAYYLDYQNRRADYAAAVFDKLLNWRFVEANLDAA